MKVITRQVFETDDGRIFDNEKDASAHEDGLREVKYFLVHYNPDLCEGRCSAQSSGLIAVCALDSHRAFAEHACYHIFGSSWAFVQGVFGANAIIPNWRISCEQSKVDGYNIIATVQAKFTTKKLWKDGIDKLIK